jgi:integrase
MLYRGVSIIVSIIQSKNDTGNKVNSKMAYIDSIQDDKPGTRINKIASINIFDDFILSEYSNSTSESVIQDMLDNLEMTTGIFQVLHEFAIFAQKRVSYDTLTIYLCWLRKYLHARGVKIDIVDMNEYFKLNNTMKAPLKELKKPLKLSEIQRIISISDIKRQRIYSILVSSGIRIGEAMSLRKSDLSFEHERVMITIRAENAKNKEERITFMSEEARELCQPLFDSIGNDDLIFGNGDITKASNVINENQVFDRTRKRLGLTERYKSRTHKITIHSMRAFFISKMIKQNENLGHALSGHSSYMKRYERLEISELIEAYIKSEPELTIIDLTRKDTEIKNLKNANMQNSQLQLANKMLLDIIRKLPISDKIKEDTAKSLSDEDYLI